MTSTQIVYLAALVLLTAGLLFMSRSAFSRLSGYDVEDQLTEADNPAVGVALFGFLVAMIIVLAALLSTEGPADNDPVALAWDLGETLLYGVVSILLLALSGWVNDRLILHRFENRKELVEDRNVGVAVTICGSYIASGLVLAGAFSGRVDRALLAESSSHIQVISQELGIGLAFFALGQVVLVIYGLLYTRLSKNDVLDAIERDYEVAGVKHGGNAAAGIALGGNLAAVGLALWGGIEGDFTGWSDNLLTFGIAAGACLVLMPVWRLFTDHVLLSRANLAKEIYVDRNVNAALLETAALVGLAMLIAVVI